MEEALITTVVGRGGGLGSSELAPKPEEGWLPQWGLGLSAWQH